MNKTKRDVKSLLDNERLWDSDEYDGIIDRALALKIEKALNFYFTRCGIFADEENGTISVVSSITLEREIYYAKVMFSDDVFNVETFSHEDELGDSSPFIISPSVSSIIRMHQAAYFEMLRSDTTTPEKITNN